MVKLIFSKTENVKKNPDALNQKNYSHFLSNSFESETMTLADFVIDCVIKLNIRNILSINRSIYFNKIQNNTIMCLIKLCIYSKFYKNTKNI